MGYVCLRGRQAAIAQHALYRGSVQKSVHPPATHMLETAVRSDLLQPHPSGVLLIVSVPFALLRAIVKLATKKF